MKDSKLILFWIWKHIKYIMSLDELTYSYPSQNDLLFQEKISSKKEFADLKLPREVEPHPIRGQFYAQQKMGSLFMRFYDSLVLNHEPGVGKTDWGWKAGEDFRASSNLPPDVAYRRGVVNWVKKMYIVVPGPAVANLWAAAYAKHSSSPSYPKDFYQIYHHQEFSTLLARMSDDDLKRFLENTCVYIDEVHEIFGRSKKKIEERNLYESYRTSFEKIERIKIIIATGTLIIMSPIELSYAINLTKPERQIPTDESFYDVESDEELERKLLPYLTGKISHVKNKQNIARISWPPEAISIAKEEVIQFKVVPYPMTKIQNRIYEKTPYESFESNRVSVSIIGIPPNNPSMVHSLSYEAILERACKIIALVEILQREGVKFIFSGRVLLGVDLVENILKYLGYEHFTRPTRIGSGRPRKEESGLPFPTTKRKRYITIRQGDKDTEQKLAIVNNPLNLDGEYVEIVLTSSVGELGISVHHVQTYVVLDPAGQMSTETQRQFRFLRPASNIDLYRRNLERGLTGDDAIVKIMAYYMVAMPLNPNVISIDLEMYKDNLKKDYPLFQTRMITYRTAFDAQLAFDRNQRNCLDGDSCVYGFAGKEVKMGSDTSTYELLFAKNDVSGLIAKLINSLLIELSVDVDEFWKRNRTTESELAYYTALRQILDNNDGRITTITGEIAYMKQEGNIVFLQTETNEEGWMLPNTSVYVRPHVSYLANNADGVEMIEDFSTVEDLRVFLDSTTIGDKNLLNRKINVLESILITREPADFYRYIMDRYKDRYVFIVNKPIGYLEDLSKYKTEKQRISLAEVITSTPNQKIGDEIMVHTFRAQINPYRNAAYQIYFDHTQARFISLHNEIRGMFMNFDKGSPEQLAYSALISERIMEPFVRFNNRMKNLGRKGLVWGLFFDPERIFRIFDNRHQSNKTKGGQNEIPRSRVYTSYYNADYLDIFVNLGISDIIMPKEDAEKINLPPILMNNKKNSTGKDWINEILKELKKKPGKVGKEGITAIQAILKERLHLYNDPADGILLYKLFKIYIIPDKPFSHRTKKDLASNLLEYFVENNQVFYF